MKGLYTFSPPLRKRSTAARLMCCFWQSSSSTCLMEAPCRRGMEQLEPSGSITVHVLLHRSLSFSQTVPELLSSHCFTHTKYYKTIKETKKVSLLMCQVATLPGICKQFNVFYNVKLLVYKNCIFLLFSLTKHSAKLSVMQDDNYCFDLLKKPPLAYLMSKYCCNSLVS